MSDMPREHLEKYALRIREELEREREERNFFQLERDKLRTFWEITRQQQEENKAELRCTSFHKLVFTQWNYKYTKVRFIFKFSTILFQERKFPSAQ